MAFTWHGRDNGGKVWEQEITRYYFISGEEIVVPAAHGPRPAVQVGTRLKLTKSEANKFFVRGYVDYHTTVWDEKSGRYNRTIIQLTNGRIGKDIESRVLHESECKPEDVSRRRKKLDNPQES